MVFLSHGGANEPCFKHIKRVDITRLPVNTPTAVILNPEVSGCGMTSVGFKEIFITGKRV
jgi:hypothetical protein